MKKLEMDEFGVIMLDALTKSHNNNTRLGQEIFNATYFFFPELADSLRGTGADCFYNDNKIIHFVNAILK